MRMRLSLHRGRRDAVACHDAADGSVPDGDRCAGLAALITCIALRTPSVRAVAPEQALRPLAAIIVLLYDPGLASAPYVRR